MDDYFKPLKRRIGIIVLSMALISLAWWLVFDWWERFNADFDSRDPIRNYFGFHGLVTVPTLLASWLLLSKSHDADDDNPSSNS